MSVSPAGEPWQLITSLARSTASEVSQSTLRKDISRTLPAPSEATVAKLLELLERVFILETIQPWAVSLRSKARLRRSPKYHLADRHWLPPRCTLTPAASAQTRRHSVSCSSPLSSTIYWPTPRPWEGIFTTIATPTGTRSTQ